MRTQILILALLGLTLSACDENPNRTKVYQITISNITNKQLLTPPAVFLHKGELNLWSLGAAASNGLEVLAEGGNPADLIAEKQDQALVSKAADGPVAPGDSYSVELTVEADDDVSLSFASMLAFTNDGFTGVDAMRIGELTVGSMKQAMTRIFDAGTEANSETAASVPGLGGAGYESGREDRDRVVIHPGVVTQDDGLATSGLNQEHRFLSYGALVKVKRVE